MEVMADPGFIFSCEHDMEVLGEKDCHYYVAAVLDPQCSLAPCWTIL